MNQELIPVALVGWALLYARSKVGNRSRSRVNPDTCDHPTEEYYVSAGRVYCAACGKEITDEVL